jgi:hypothetical protein
MRRLLRRLRDSTIWARGSIRPEEYRFRNIFRVVLPLTDLLYLWFGIVGYASTVSSVEAVAGQEWQNAWSAIMAGAAFLCFVGVSFPRLWLLEMIAKIALIGTVLFYIMLQLTRIFDPEVSAFSGLIVVLILTLGWRFVDLSATRVRPLMRRRLIRQDKTVRDAE